jgi:predicted RNase H-like nuclease (RuvC/YqgF family)
MQRWERVLDERRRRAAHYATKLATADTAEARAAVVFDRLRAAVYSQATNRRDRQEHPAWEPVIADLAEQVQRLETDLVLTDRANTWWQSQLDAASTQARLAAVWFRRLRAAIRRQPAIQRDREWAELERRLTRRADRLDRLTRQLAKTRKTRQDPLRREFVR